MVAPNLATDNKYNYVTIIATSFFIIIFKSIIYGLQDLIFFCALEKIQSNTLFI